MGVIVVYDVDDISVDRETLASCHFFSVKFSFNYFRLLSIIINYDSTKPVLPFAASRYSKYAADSSKCAAHNTKERTRTGG